MINYTKTKIKCFMITKANIYSICILYKVRYLFKPNFALTISRNSIIIEFNISNSFWIADTIFNLDSDILNKN